MNFQLKVKTLSSCDAIFAILTERAFPSSAIIAERCFVLTTGFLKIMLALELEGRFSRGTQRDTSHLVNPVMSGIREHFRLSDLVQEDFVSVILDSSHLSSRDTSCLQQE